MALAEQLCADPAVLDHKVTEEERKAFYLIRQRGLIGSVAHSTWQLMQWLSHVPVRRKGPERIQKMYIFEVRHFFFIGIGSDKNVSTFARIKRK